MKIVLAGGSGYIGSVMASYYAANHWDVCILSRAAKPTQGKIRTVIWDAKNAGPWTNELEGADVLINLTGKNVNCRYNEANQREILNSRLEATEALHRAVSQLKKPPLLWIQITSATIYRHAEDRAMDESTGEIGSGFSVDVCQQWEQAFWNKSHPGVRTIALRTGIVLGSGDGVLPRLIRLTRFGLGGKQGNGRQRISWIHEKDMVNIVEWIRTNRSATGTYNATAPGPETNDQFMRLLRRQLRIPFGMNAPAWLLSIGAWLIGTETELIFKSRWVIPARLQHEGFSFEFATLPHALKDIIAR